MKKEIPFEHSFPFKTGTSGIRMFAALLFALACAATALSAATITVTSTADTGPDAPPPGTLRAALASAADGDTINATGISGTITLMAGVTAEDAQDAQLVVDKSVTILGPGPTNLTVDANHLSRVFVITPGHTVTIEGLRIVNGSSIGGGIFNDASMLTVNNCVLSGNSSSGDGGAIFNFCRFDGNATLKVNNSTLSANSATDDGGGIYNVAPGSGSAALTVKNSTLSGNSARNGGAIYNDGGTQGGAATVALGNCTLTGNLAVVVGGAMVNGGGDATILACTFSGNSAGVHSGGISGGDGSTKVGNTIMKHGQGANLNKVVSLGFNLISDDPATFLPGTGDRINTDPLLGPLADNGGSTLTHLPMPGSPALDRASSDLLGILGLTTDQRGLPRLFDDPGTPNAPFGDGTDIGAVEIQQPTALNLVWTNLAGGDWNVATNWQPNAVPTRNDNAIITNTVTVTVSSPAECFGLTLGSLSSSPTLTGGGTLTLYGPSVWANGTMSGSGRTVVEASGSLLLTSPTGVFLTGRTLENAGTVLWTGAGNLGLLNGVITNRAGALFHVQTAAQFSFAGGTCRFDNAGTFRKSVSTGTTTMAVSFNNSGTVEIQTGTLHFSGSFNNNNLVNLSAGTTNRIAAGGSATGTFDTPATALMEWTGGTFLLDPGAQLSGAGLYRINGISAMVVGNGDVTVQNLDLVNASSTLSGTGILTIANAMNWTAGTMSGSGRTFIPVGASLQVGNPSGVGLQRTLENGGTVLWTGAGGVSLLNGVVTNRAGGLFEAQNAAQFFFAGGGCRFDNAGTFRKSANTGTTTVPSGVNFNNSGTVDIRSGILAANGGYVSSSNALLNCALGGTTAGTGHGQLQVAGTVTLNGGLSVDLINGFSPALNDSFTVLTAGTRGGTFGNFLYPSNVVTMQLSNAPTSVIVRVTGILDVPRPVLLPPELSGTDIKLIWTAVSNATYRLEFNPDLNPSNWNALPDDVIGVSNTASKLDALTSSNRFYRVRVIP